VAHLPGIVRASLAMPDMGKNTGRAADDGQRAG